MVNTQLVSSNLRLNNALQLTESVSEAANSMYYLFTARPYPYDGGDGSIPSPNDSIQQTFIQIYKDMIFGKNVKAADMNIVVPRYDWTTNTVYTQYDHTDGNLHSNNFYVVVNATSNYYIFKCLYNNNGASSTQQPNISDTSPADTYYQTSDGYVWKFMTGIDSTTFNKFSTHNTNYDVMPVIANTQVSGNAVSGSLDIILVPFGGSGYSNYTNGQFNSGDIRIGGNTVLYNISANASSTNNIYLGCYLVITDGTGKGEYQQIVDYHINGSQKLVTLQNAFLTVPDATSTYDISPRVVIVGDGQESTNAQARAIVNSSGNVVSSVQDLNRGAGYFTASANVYASDVVAVSNTAQLRVILPPRGGHGYYIEEELGGTSVCVSVKFSNNESNTIPVTNGFRQIGLIKNPLFQNITLSLLTTDGSPGSNGTFQINDLVTQDNSGAYGIVNQRGDGTITVTNSYGYWVTGNSTYGLINNQGNSATAQVNAITNNDQTKGFDTFNQMYRFIGTPVAGTFQNSEQINFTPSGANAILHSAVLNSGSLTLYAVEKFGTFAVGNTVTGSNSGAVVALTSIYGPDLVIGSGDVMYIENLAPISRSNTTSELVKLIINF